MCLVVSSDNEVRAHALACGADVLGAQEFIADSKKERQDPVEMQEKTRQLSESEVRYWLRQFGENPDEGRKE
jgi:hypothetical protein